MGSNDGSGRLDDFDPDNNRKLSSVSYNSYDTLTSLSSINSNSLVYDTIQSTQTGVSHISTDSYLDLIGYFHPDENDNSGGGKQSPNSSEKLSPKMVGDWLKGRQQGITRNYKKHLNRKFPITDWLPQYNLSFAISDLIAGLTVGLTVIPQGIAYAIVAGLPPQYGLYSAFMGCFVYCIFGSCKDITIGPTAIMALMTSVHAQYGPQYAVLLTFLSGIIILLCGLLQLGFLIDFISVPVIAGFTSAAALTIASGQWKSLLGVSIDPHHKSHTHAGVVDYYIDIFHNISTVRYQDALLGFICCIILLSLRALNRTGWFKPIQEGSNPGPVQRMTNKLPSRSLRVLDKLVWFICTARNAIVVIVCLIMAMVMDPEGHSCKSDPDKCVFSLTGKIEGGLPDFQAPPFSLDLNITHEFDNGTISQWEMKYFGFGDMVSTLGAAIIIIPVIAILESVAIAKAFAGGKSVDASQEMIALGLCNIFGSFVQSMPTTGSFSRTAVNSSSGVKTAFGGIYTGLLVIVCLAFLMPYCAFIPKATLAAVIMTAVIFSVEHHVIRPMWSSKKIDLLPGFVCFFVGLLYELEMGIFTGVGTHLLIVLYSSARPRVRVEIKQVPGVDQHYICITPDQGIVFPSVTYMRNLISKAAMKQGNSKMAVVINCMHVSHTDFTAAESFHAMIEDFKSRGQPVYWFATNTNVIRTLKSVTGQDLKIISGPIELVKYQGTPPKLKVSKDTDMVTIEEESPLENNGASSTNGDSVNKSPMPELVPKSFATLFNEN